MAEQTKTSTHTKIRHVRVPDPLWVESCAKAEDDGYRISEVVRALLRGYNRGDFVI